MATQKLFAQSMQEKNRQYPDYIISFYGKSELLAKYRGISFDKIIASQDNKLFLGLSNSGLPGTAVVLFDQNGNLLLEVKHRMASFDYCEESATLTRTWFDEKNPDVKYIADEKYGGLKSITLRDCRGKTVDLMTTFLLSRLLVVIAPCTIVVAPKVHIFLVKRGTRSFRCQIVTLSVIPFF